MEREDVKHAPRRSSRGSLLYQDASQLTVGSQHSRRSTVTYASNRTETSLASDASRRQTNRGWVPVSHPCRGRCPVLQRPVGHTTHNLTKPVSNDPLPVLSADILQRAERKMSALQGAMRISRKLRRPGTSFNSRNGCILLPRRPATTAPASNTCKDTLDTQEIQIRRRQTHGAGHRARIRRPQRRALCTLQSSSVPFVAREPSRGCLVRVFRADLHE